MNERLTAWTPLVLLAFLAALTFWLDRTIQPPPGAHVTAARHDPDYIVDKLSAVRMDTMGRVKQTLFAEKMTHFPDNDSTVLVSPRLTSQPAGQAPVTITAREALVSADGENVYFQDDVRVARAADGKSSPMVMTTSFLHVIPDEDIARTDRPVRIVDANTVVEAVGLELNNATRVLNLLSRVKVTYHDPKRPARSAVP
jgi:lipopolysaccharide export system protein LptC